MYLQFKKYTYFFNLFLQKIHPQKTYTNVIRFEKTVYNVYELYTLEKPLK
jgi:hypothetical protein